MDQSLMKEDGGSRPAGDPLSHSFPRSIDEFRRAGSAFAAELQELKQRVQIPGHGWYPYGTIGILPFLSDLLQPVYQDIAEEAAVSPVADIGCGDGDLSIFFSRLGCEVDAIDHAQSSFNQFRGIEVLRHEFNLPVHVHDIDLDGPFELPRRHYCLALFLGILYHLKNPFYVLEKISSRAEWCVLSTRIAQVTPDKRTRLEEEPVAYLLGPREANNDPTNFWIFSVAGLRRLLERTGWVVHGMARLGCAADSDPASTEGDERVFIVAKSWTRHPGMHVRLLHGWHPVEDGVFRWTAKRFAMEVSLPIQAREFRLAFSVPKAAIASGPVRLSCSVGGQPAGSVVCESTKTMEFRGKFPFEATVFRMDFTVESNFQPPGDSRDLGVCIPLNDPSETQTERMPLRIF